MWSCRSEVRPPSRLTSRSSTRWTDRSTWCRSGPTRRTGYLPTLHGCPFSRFSRGAGRREWSRPRFSSRPGPRRTSSSSWILRRLWSYQWGAPTAGRSRSPPARRRSRFTAPCRTGRGNFAPTARWGRGRPPWEGALRGCCRRGTTTLRSAGRARFGQQLADVLLLLGWGVALAAAFHRLRARWGDQLTMASLELGPPSADVSEIDWSEVLDGQSVG